MSVPFLYLFTSCLASNKTKRSTVPIPVTIIFRLHGIKRTRRTHISIETCIYVYVYGTFEISYSNDATNMDTLKLKFCIIDEMLCMHKPHVLNSHISWPNPIMLCTISRQKMLNEIMLIFILLQMSRLILTLLYCVMHTFVCFSFKFRERLNFACQYFISYKMKWNISILFRRLNFSKRSIWFVLTEKFELH